MHDRGSISRLLDALQNGETSAADGIMARYFKKLAEKAEERLKQAGAKRREADGQDVAQTALYRVISGIQEGRFPKVTDRNALWGLLFRVMEGKASNQARRERAAIRGGGKVRGDSVFDKPGESVRKGLDDFEQPEPSPRDVEELESLLEHCLAQLDEDVQQAVLLDLQGYTDKEIASQCNCAVSAVERRLRLAREYLKRQLEE